MIVLSWGLNQIDSVKRLNQEREEKGFSVTFQIMNHHTKRLALRPYKSTDKKAKYQENSDITKSSFPSSEPAAADTDSSDEVLSEFESEVFSTLEPRSESDDKPKLTQAGVRTRGSFRMHRNDTLHRRYQSKRYFKINFISNCSLATKPLISYEHQLMPANFTQILERESKALEGLANSEDDAQSELKKLPIYRNMDSEKPRYKDHSSKSLSLTDRFNPVRRRSSVTKQQPNYHTSGKKGKERLNESDDDTAVTVPKSRLFGLFQSSSLKNQILPVNLKKLLAQEQMRLLERIPDEHSKRQFMNAVGVDKKELEDSLDSEKVTFDDVSGFEKHVISLKEMVGLPLM